MKSKSRFNDIIKEAIDFYAEEVVEGVFDVVPNFRIVATDKFRGSFDLESNIMTIGWVPGLRDLDVALTTLHEMVHWQQWAEGRLKLVETSMSYMLQFENSEYRYEQCCKESPWEVEAYSKQYGLLSKFLLYRS